MWACNRLDLQTLGCHPVIMPKNLSDHRLDGVLICGEPSLLLLLGGSLGFLKGQI